MEVGLLSAELDVDVEDQTGNRIWWLAELMHIYQYIGRSGGFKAEGH